MSNLLKAQSLPPLVLSLAETRKILFPLAFGYPWAEGTIDDLWHQCAPTPESFRPGATERRIISPAHLGEWLSDVLTRQGKPLTEQARIYKQFMGATNGR